MAEQSVIPLCRTCSHPAAWHTWGKGCEGHNPWHGNPAEVCACEDYDNGRPLLTYDLMDFDTAEPPESETERYNREHMG